MTQCNYSDKGLAFRIGASYDAAFECHNGKVRDALTCIELERLVDRFHGDTYVMTLSRANDVDLSNQFYTFNDQNADPTAVDAAHT